MIRKSRITGAVMAVIAALLHFGTGAGSLSNAELSAQLYGQGTFYVGIFFVALAIGQLIWSGVVLKSNNRVLLVIGILGFMSSIVIYFASTVEEFPFGIARQPISPFAIVTKIVEAAFVVSSVSIIRSISGH